MNAPHPRKRARKKPGSAGHRPRKQTAPTASRTTLASGHVGGKLLACFKQLAQSLGLDPIQLVRETGIHPRHLEDSGLALSSRKVDELLEHAALSRGIEDFGLRLAEIYGIPDLGPAGLLMREEPTVRDALQTLIALRNLHSDPDSAHLGLEEGQMPLFRADIMRKGKPFSRQTTDLAIALNTHILRSLLGEGWAPVSVCFIHSRPQSSARFNRFFRCPVLFDQELNGIALRRQDLDRKMQLTSSIIRWQMDLFIRTIDIVPANADVHRAAQLVAIALPRGQANATTVARCLGCDRRTLNRRLEQAGLNYSGLVDSIRKNLAAQYLLGSGRPLREASDLLGFASSSAFIRWFRRAFGRTPKAWRKAHVPIA